MCAPWGWGCLFVPYYSTLRNLVTLIYSHYYTLKQIVYTHWNGINFTEENTNYFNDDLIHNTHLQQNIIKNSAKAKVNSKKQIFIILWQKHKFFKCIISDSQLFLHSIVQSIFKRLPDKMEECNRPVLYMHCLQNVGMLEMALLRETNWVFQRLTFDICDPDGKSLFWFWAQEVILYCLEDFSLSMCILSKLFTFF